MLLPSLLYSGERGWGVRGFAFAQARPLKKGQFNLSQFDNLGVQPTLKRRAEGEILHLVFLHENHLHPQRLKELLADHLRGFRETFSK